MRFALAAFALSSIAVPLGLLSQEAPRKRAEGYLAGPSVPDLTHVLPSAPKTGDTRDIADRTIFKNTRSLKDSSRWQLAQNDDKLSIAALLTDFRCSLGSAPTAENAPVLTRMLNKVSTDAGAATGPAKEFFQRKRPFLVDKGDVCLTISDSFARSFDYPSGHTTLGWAVGLILAELDPQHATAILERARAFGESRVVCGVHNASAVEAGRAAGAAIVAALHSNDAFRADFESARGELAAIRSNKSAVDPSCATEASLIEKTPY
jgi:acid phosphatase (class A)